MDKVDDLKYLDELAKRLSVAYVSYVAGITMQTCYKNITKSNIEVGDYWYTLAQQIVDHNCK